MYLCCSGEAGGQSGELSALAASGLCLGLYDDGLQADCVGGGGLQARHGVVSSAGDISVSHQLRELGSRGLKLTHSYPEDLIIIIIMMSSAHLTVEAVLEAFQPRVTRSMPGLRVRL